MYDELTPSPESQLFSEVPRAGINIPEGGFPKGGEVLRENDFFKRFIPEILDVLEQKYDITTRHGLNAFFRECLTNVEKQSIYSTASFLCAGAILKEPSPLSKRSMYLFACALDLVPEKAFERAFSAMTERSRHAWVDAFNGFRSDPTLLQSRLRSVTKTIAEGEDPEEKKQGGAKLVVDAAAFSQLMETVARLQSTVARLETEIDALKKTQSAHVTTHDMGVLGEQAPEPAVAVDALRPREGETQRDAFANDDLVAIITDAVTAATMPLENMLHAVMHELTAIRMAQNAADSFHGAAAIVSAPPDAAPQDGFLGRAPDAVPPEPWKNAQEGHKDPGGAPNSFRQELIAPVRDPRVPSKEAEIFGSLVRRFSPHLLTPRAQNPLTVQEFCEAIKVQPEFTRLAVERQGSVLAALRAYHQGERSPLNEAGNLEAMVTRAMRMLKMPSSELEKVPALTGALLWTSEVRTTHTALLKRMTAAGLYTIPSIENQLGILLPAADKADLVALLKSKNPEDITKPNNHAARLLEILYNAFDCAREAPVFTREKRPLEPAM